MKELDAALGVMGLPIEGLRSLATSTESPRDIATADLLSSMRSSLGSHPAWIASFERVVLGELALSLDARFEALRDELHAAHAGVAAYDRKAGERAAARRAAMDSSKKRKKKPLPLP